MSDSWHLDKRIPVLSLFGLVAQTVAMVWWAAMLTASVSQHGKDIASLQARESARGVEERRMSEALARLDERLRAQTEILQRMERAMAR